MNKITLGLTTAALAIAVTAGGVVYAEQNSGGQGWRNMMADPLGDATITRADAAAKAGALFDRLDLNHDGKIDAADRAVRIGQHFDKMDTNHDGVLSRQEFIAAHEQAMKDHDGADGHRGPRHDEGMGHEGMGPGGMHHGMGMDGPMAGMDANGDRAITRAEFLDSAMKRFDAADINHDGKLTKDERRAAFMAHLREMREGMGGGMHDGDMPPPPAAPAGQ